MDILSLVAGCGLFISRPCPPTAQAATPVSQWHPMVQEAASMFAMPEAWVSAVMARESGGKTVLNGRPITSSAGAMGLMQLMPDTYDDLRKQYRLRANAYDPRDNILAGTAYLRQMYVRYGYPGMFVAYNAGPGRFDDYLTRQRPLPGETLKYLAAIVPGSENAFGDTKGARPSGKPRHESEGIFAPPAPPGALFVTLSSQHF